MYGRYPFLIGAKSLLDRNSSEIKHKQQTINSITTLLRDDYMCFEQEQDIIEVNVFYNSLIIVKKLNNSFITKRFVEHFAKRFEYFVFQDINNIDVREQVLDFCRIESKIQFIGNEVVAMKVTDYLMMVRDEGGSLFKLIHTSLKNGRITMSTKHFCLLLRIKIEKTLLKRIGDMPSMDGIEFGYGEQLEQLSKKHKITPGPQNVTNTRINEPPCIAQMIERGKTTHHLTHIERVTLGIYLKSKGYDEEYILDIFRGLSDWDERITRYQLGRLGNYKVYGCDKMQTEGLCCREKDRLNRCSRITNPYQY